MTEKNGLLWAFGMVGTLPTAKDSDVAGKQLRLGSEALLAKFEEWGVYGIFPSHQWDVTGWGDTYFSTSQLQLFLKFLPGGGWNVGTTPIMNLYTIPAVSQEKKSDTMEILREKLRADKKLLVANS